MKNKILVYPAGLMITVLILFISCKKESQTALPSLTTTPVIISGSSATTGGNIINDGGMPVINTGICYSTSPNPTIDNSTAINYTKNSASFTKTIFCLSPNTTYYARAYATNFLGTGYGNEVTFITGTSIPPPGGLTDADGNTYPSVIIGCQEWMVGNLKTTKYNDGTAIPLVTDFTIWRGLITPAYCWYNNDASTYKNTYGALYNWYTVNTGKLAPTGWHIPTAAEWTILENYLGGSTVAGGKLKETGTSHWYSPNTGATDEVGFKGLPGGKREGVDYEYLGIYGFWWSSSESAWSLRLDYEQSYGSNGWWLKYAGNSVRCIKD